MVGVEDYIVFPSFLLKHPCNVRITNTSGIFEYLRYLPMLFILPVSFVN